MLSTAIALAIGIALVGFVGRKLKLENGALLVSVLFAPAILYLGLSGRLLEFKGLGLEAKFQAVAKQTVAPVAKITPVAPSASEAQSVATAKALFGMGAPVVFLTVKQRAGESLASDVNAYAQKIYPGLLDGSFDALVVIDEYQRVLGYFPRTYFLDLLRIELEQTQRGDRLTYTQDKVNQLLEQTQLWEIVANPKVRAKNEGPQLLLPKATTNADALAKLAKAEEQVAVVVDEDGKYAGIVRRSDVVAELLGALTR